MNPAPTKPTTRGPIVNLVFHHLAEQGLHPELGEHGDPGAAARDLLLALGISPAAEGNRQIRRDVYSHLAEIRETVFDDNGRLRG